MMRIHEKEEEGQKRGEEAERVSVILKEDI